MSIGRPKASSREVLAEAACELFLERGYDATTVADITTRAGVSRSSFFNYFSSKADVVWAALDERLDAATASLAVTGATGIPVPTVLRELVTAFAPDSLALAIANSAAMGVDADLERERAIRQLHLGRAIAARLRTEGASSLASETRGATLAGAVFAAIWEWAHGEPGRSDLAEVWDDALHETHEA